MAMKFKIVSKFKPTGDQPQAIRKLVKGIKKKYRFQTLLGVTGSGKTYTMASVIEKIQKPTLIISHNKTLAAQLYEEFKSFFPKNAVHYFVSYYDYYQPEAYLPQTDTYIAKDAKINEKIDQLRHEAVQSVLTRNDVIVVSSVSCIYNLGSPKTYQNLVLNLKKEQKITRRELFQCLVDLQYERGEYDFFPGRFRTRLDFVDIFSPTGSTIYRLKIELGKIKEIYESQGCFNKFRKINSLKIFPAKFWLSEKEKLDIAIANIKLELQEQVKKFKKQRKIIEAYRLQKRTDYDLSLLKEVGWCKGIENYSRHLDFRKKGEPPFTLLDYFIFSFKKDFLIFIDESHMTIPQIKGMYEGEKSRKLILIEYGFRLPSSLDNRPLKFDEFLKKISQAIFVSATPADFERKKSLQIVEQLIRPTYLLDPSIEVKPTKNQIEVLIKEIEKRVKKNQRVLVLVLTKKLAETLAGYLKEKKIKAAFFHSEIKTLIRPSILNELREGKYDVLVGINLLREGLDLPEVSLIAILDADKEGFLRDQTSLIQVMGRASRHPEGHIIMFADRITKSMKKAIEETLRRRKIQEKYNVIHKIKPRPVIKEIKITLPTKELEEIKSTPKEEFFKFYLKNLENRLELAQRNLQFEEAAFLTQKIKEIKSKIKQGR
ncbi:excinuclease ABC subunit UvrB [bacterium]|nr:excinuclease ABC subunit UvrB [bacterium]